MDNRGRAAACVAAVLVLALGGCGDAEAVAKAEAAARAKKAEAAKAERQQARIAHNVDCLSALRWQKPALAKAGIGAVDLYEAHFSERLDDALGSTMVRGEGDTPVLSRATLSDYLDWAYAENVRTKFTAGSGAERSKRGFNIVSACVQEVAEAGKGPLAGSDMVGRAAKIQALRGRLEDKDA